MLKRYLIILFTTLLLFNCSNDDFDTTIQEEPIGNVYHENKIDAYYYGYMNFGGSIMSNPNTVPLVNLVYNGNKIIKKNGGFIEINPATGFDYRFETDIYLELEFPDNNTILIEQKTDREDLIIDHIKHKITLENNNIIQKTSNYNYDSYYDIDQNIDSIAYSYNANGKIIESVKKSYWYNPYYNNGSYILGNYYYSTYNYNASNNLDSIVTNKHGGYQNEFQLTIIETFSDYDTADNPLKNLIIFDESFNRSLSDNNFKHYKKESFNDPNFPSILIRTWEFSYDPDGSIRFDLF